MTCPHLIRARARRMLVTLAEGMAAARALERGVSRVMIVDWDVHHGNGIQHIFEDDDRLVYQQFMSPVGLVGRSSWYGIALAR